MPCPTRPVAGSWNSSIGPRRRLRELTDRLPVSQPAVSQHLKVLRQARLVRSTSVGASNVYALDPEGLTAVRSWLESVWDDVLDAFAESAITTPKERPR